MILTCTLIGAFILHLVSSEVQHFQSSLATTGRRHPCRGELLTFTCEVVGSRLDWRVDSIHRARYFDTNRVDEVRTVNGPNIKFRTIMTGNEEVTGTTGSSRRLTSTLIAELSQSSTSTHGISCSSDSPETQLLQFQIAERPRQPENVTVTSHLVQSSQVPYSLTVRWDAPANIDKFDLKHYTIQALSSEVGKGYELNVTGSELEYPFGLIKNTSFPRYELNNLTVSAVSKCSQQGSEASATVPTPNVNPNNPMEVSVDIFDSTTTTVTFVSNGNRILHTTLDKGGVSAIALLIATMMMIILCRDCQSLY